MKSYSESDKILPNSSSGIERLIERVRSEQSTGTRQGVLPLNERELLMLTNSVPIRIAVVDKQKRFRFSNLAHRQSWGGVDGLEIVGRSMQEVLGEENYESAKPYVDRALAGEEVNFEMTVAYTTTDPRFVRVHYLPHLDERGDVNGCLILAIDITERRLSQEALKQSEARFGRLVEHTPVVPWEYDIDSRLFTYVGFRAEQLLGFPLSEWMRPRFHDRHVHVEDIARVHESFREGISSARDFELEYRLIHKDGSVLWFRDLVSIVQKQGRALTLQGLLIDITLSKQADFERRRLEDRIREFQKMQALGTLAGGIAHDFNNILGGIIGYTELALSIPSASAKHSSYLEGIRESSHRARDLVNQILSFSRGRDLERRDVDLSQVVREVVHLVRATTPSQIDIRVVEPDRPMFVSVNVTQMHQVILNICTNAVHAMRAQGGSLTIQFQILSRDQILNLHHPDLSVCDYVKLTIRDSGHGMSEIVKERIFEPYFTTKGVGEGTGLGLAVAHGIVSQHGGIITVESELGKGTVFDVFLPFVAAQDLKPLQEERAREVDSALAQGRIVIVDDEETLVQIGTEMLEHLGYVVHGFTSSSEALNFLEQHGSAIDLLITDQTMPELTGDVLIKNIRAIFPNMPIVLCTGYSAVIDAQSGARLGVSAFLQKPYSIVQLCSTVKAVLELSRTDV